MLFCNKTDAEIMIQTQFTDREKSFSTGFFIEIQQHNISESCKVNHSIMWSCLLRSRSYSAQLTYSWRWIYCIGLHPKVAVLYIFIFQVSPIILYYWVHFCIWEYQNQWWTVINFVYFNHSTTLLSATKLFRISNYFSIAKYFFTDIFVRFLF